MNQVPLFDRINIWIRVPVHSSPVISVIPDVTSSAVVFFFIEGNAKKGRQICGWEKDPETARSPHRGPGPSDR